MSNHFRAAIYAFGLWIALLSAGMAHGEDKAQRVFMFGNSLINHATESDETTVPHWLALMSRAAEHDFTLSGQWGFLRNFQRNLPPESNWGFKEVNASWDQRRHSFFEAGFTSIWINPANFIQYQGYNVNFDGDTTSPFQATLDVLQWATDAGPDVQLYVYEGWPEMAGIAPNFPPNADGLAKYHAYALGPYAKWYDDYVADLNAAIPSHDVALVPVSRVLASVMTETALAALPAETFYTDDAPHGTAALYLLAALVSYNVMFDEPVPESFRPPSTLSPEIRATFPMVRDAIWERVAAFNQSAKAEPTPVSVATAVQESESSNETTADPKRPFRQKPLVNPSLAMGLNGITDWSVQHPFLDFMKSARPWTGHTKTERSAISVDDMEEAGLLDENGWLMRMPEGATVVEAFFLTEQPEEATDLIGRYTLFYEGSGSIRMGGRAKNVSYSDGKITFDYTPGEDLVAIAITKTDPEGTGDYIRNIRIYRDDQMDLVEAGAVFNPAFIERIENLRSVRFMDWMSTNGSKSTSWDTRAQLDNFTYMRGGVPLELAVDLANLIGADPWFNMPHMADDDYMRQFAEYVRDNLRPDLKAYVEYSNEVWNFVFPQTTYALAKAKERWGRKGVDSAWMQFYGMRSAQMAQIWAKVYGREADERLIPVISTHTGWLGLEEPALNAPLWVAEDPENNWEPYVYFSAYAITGYFGHSLGGDEQAPDVLEWLAASKRKAENDALTKGLSQAERDAYVEKHKYDAAHVLVDKALREGSVKEMMEETFPAHAAIAADHGLDLVMYEGGTHVAVAGEWTQNQELIEYFKVFNYTPQMADIYRDILASWKDAGGQIFNAFVDVSMPSQYGSWGALRHLQDSNLRWDALMDFNENVPAWWERRDPSTFEGGRILQGSADADELLGTTRNDVLVGGDGDDVLRPVAGQDKLHGGAGEDAALLPGNPSDYRFARIEGGLRVRSETLDAELRDIEMLWFEGDEELAIMTRDLL